MGDRAERALNQREVTGGLDGPMLWDLRPRSWLAAACSLAGRNLTDGERERFVRRTVDPCRL